MQGHTEERDIVVSDFNGSPDGDGNISARSSHPAQHADRCGRCNNLAGKNERKQESSSRSLYHPGRHTEAPVVTTGRFGVLRSCHQPMRVRPLVSLLPVGHIFGREPRESFRWVRKPHAELNSGRSREQVRCDTVVLLSRRNHPRERFLTRFEPPEIPPL